MTLACLRVPVRAGRAVAAVRHTDLHALAAKVLATLYRQVSSHGHQHLLGPRGGSSPTLLEVRSTNPLGQIFHQSRRTLAPYHAPLAHEEHRPDASSSYTRKAYASMSSLRLRPCCFAIAPHEISRPTSRRALVLQRSQRPSRPLEPPHDVVVSPSRTRTARYDHWRYCISSIWPTHVRCTLM